MFDPVMVPLDGSLLAECVLQHVVAIARAFNAKVILLRVLDKKQASEKHNYLIWSIGRSIRPVRSCTWKRSVPAFKNPACGSRLLFWRGWWRNRSLNTRKSRGVKLIILSSHGRSGLSQWGISSVTQKIIFSAPTSVLIIRAHQPATSELLEQQYTR